MCCTEIARIRDTLVMMRENAANNDDSHVMLCTQPFRRQLKHVTECTEEESCLFTMGFVLWLLVTSWCRKSVLSVHNSSIHSFWCRWWREWTLYAAWSTQRPGVVARWHCTRVRIPPSCFITYYTLQFGMNCEYSWSVSLRMHIVHFEWAARQTCDENKKHFPKRAAWRETSRTKKFHRCMRAVIIFQSDIIKIISCS